MYTHWKHTYVYVVGSVL